MIDTNRTPFLNAFFDNVCLDEVLEIVNAAIESGEPGYMVSFNVDCSIKADKDSVFRRAYEAATLALMDSQPLISIANRSGIQVKQKLSGSDLMPLICEHAAQKGYSCYFFGGMPGVPETAAANMKELYPNMEIAGAFSPDYGFENDADKLADAIARVSVAGPDILFMCLGMPKSEVLLHDYLHDLNAGFAFSVGAAVDFAAGSAKRAPEWMQNAGLEWFYRFTCEPKRLFKRYFIDSWAMVGIMRRARFEKKRNRTPINT